MPKSDKRMANERERSKKFCEWLFSNVLNVLETKIVKMFRLDCQEIGKERPLVMGLKKLEIRAMVPKLWGGKGEGCSLGRRGRLEGNTKSFVKCRYFA